jgi:protein TonB
MPQNSAPVTATDRLSFTLFLAVAFHATLVFGLGFAPQSPSEAPRTIDVTVAHHKSAQAPDEADFIAQANQQGSGDQMEKQELTTDQLADFQDSRINKVQLQEQAVRERTEFQSRPLVVTTSGLSPQQVHKREKKEETPPKPLKTAEKESLEKLSHEIASLQARLDAQKQAYAQRPRVRRITSVSAKAHYEALYIDSFRREVEEMGTRNFPGRALAENKFGNVRLLVALETSGDVRNIEILKSSGHRFLDQAAVQSVRMAAPFAPFTEEMRRNMDILEIIRTWKFDPREIVTSQ